jgi:hypothetical protein
MDDLKRGTLKLPKNLEDVVRGASNEEDVIRYLEIIMEKMH